LEWIEELVNTKLIGLHIDDYTNWKDHPDEMILGGACNAFIMMFDVAQDRDRWRALVNVVTNL
jgi:hypothetical protein